MNNVLPELKKGDVLIRQIGGIDKHAVTITKVAQGKHFDEPVYFLGGMYGVKLKLPYTGEELGALGYSLKDKTNGDNHE